MKTIKKREKVQQEKQLEFDFQFGCSLLDESETYRDGAEDLIRRIVPKTFIQERGYTLPLERARFSDMLPLISWSDLSKAPCAFSAILLCKHRLNATNFFYDMLSRWLLPNQRVNVELFFTSDIRLPHLSDDLLSVAEIVIYLKSATEVEEVRKNIQTIETEIRLGIVSNYHARRILEFKGLSNDGKTAMIQEKIGSLIQSHSKDFDRGIFAQMQQFLVNCQEDFKIQRDYHHISRIISNLYSLRKVLKQNSASFPTKRHVQIKFLKTQLKKERNRLMDEQLSLIPKERHVLGILIGLNFLQDHEVFETVHLIGAIQKHLPQVQPVDGSFFIDRASDHSLQTLYLEIEKPEGSDFSLEEVQKLRISLPDQIKEHIEKLTHPIFMPRNEEEVLRNIMALSRQLRYVNDMPQVIISFDEQKGDDLIFTVILLRVHMEGSPTVQEIFHRSQTLLKYIPDRVRRVGQLRKKYVKEATVFRTVIDSSSFLRKDFSVDLYGARQAIFSELRNLLGEVRDFNGGMIYQQNQLLDALKNSLGSTAEQYPLILEKFYYALNPIEMRTSMNVESLKQFFLLFMQSIQTDCMHTKREQGDFLFKQDAKKAMAIIAVDPYRKKNLTEKMTALHFPIHQLVSFSIELDGMTYLGYLLLNEDKKMQSDFLELF